MTRRLCVDRQVLKSSINKLKQVKTTLEANPLDIMEKQGSGQTADMLEKTAKEYQKMYDALLDLNKQTIAYFQAVLDSFDIIEKAPTRAARGREQEK